MYCKMLTPWSPEPMSLNVNGHEEFLLTSSPLTLLTTAALFLQVTRPEGLKCKVYHEFPREFLVQLTCHSQPYLVGTLLIPTKISRPWGLKTKPLWCYMLGISPSLSVINLDLFSLIAPFFLPRTKVPIILIECQGDSHLPSLSISTSFPLCTLHNTPKTRDLRTLRWRHPDVMLT